jgi:hypothetical protein
MRPFHLTDVVSQPGDDRRERAHVKEITEVVKDELRVREISRKQAPHSSGQLGPELCDEQIADRGAHIVLVGHLDVLPVTKRLAPLEVVRVPLLQSGGALLRSHPSGADR